MCKATHHSSSHFHLSLHDITKLRAMYIYDFYLYTWLFHVRIPNLSNYVMSCTKAPSSSRMTSSRISIITVIIENLFILKLCHIYHWPMAHGPTIKSLLKYYFLSLFSSNFKRSSISTHYNLLHLYLAQLVLDQLYFFFFSISCKHTYTSYILNVSRILICL